MTTKLGDGADVAVSGPMVREQEQRVTTERRPGSVAARSMLAVLRILEADTVHHTLLVAAGSSRHSHPSSVPAEVVDWDLG